jgi:hypothetical protein
MKGPESLHILDMATFKRKKVPEDYTANIRREKGNSNINAQLSLCRSRAVTPRILNFGTGQQ